MPASTVIPVLAYEDVAAAAEWLCDTFGFTVRWRAGGHRAQLAVGDGAVAITEQRGVSRPAEVMVRIDDVDGHHERALERGAQIVGAPVDYPYGERQYTVVDPGGNHWTFSETIADIAPEEWGGTTA